MKTKKSFILFVSWLTMALLPVVAMAQNQKPVISDPNVEIASRTDNSIKLILPEATDDNTSWDKLEYTVMWLNADEEGAEMQWRTQKGIRTFEIYGLQPSANYYYYCSVRDEAGLVNHYNILALKTPAKRYGIKVKGIEIDADNCTDVLKDGGKVWYKPGEDGKKGELHLEGVNLSCDGPVIEIDSPTRIVFKGQNILNSKERQGILAYKELMIGKDVKASGSSLLYVQGATSGLRVDEDLTLLQGTISFTSTGMYGIYMRNSKLKIWGTNINVRSYRNDGIAIYNCGGVDTKGLEWLYTEDESTIFTWLNPSKYDPKDKKFKVSGVETNWIMAYFRDARSYDVYFGGIEVTSHNNFDVLNDGGSVSYVRNDYGQGHFYLNNAHWDVGDLKSPNGNTIFDTKGTPEASYTFHITGENSLTSKDKGFYLNANVNLYFLGPGSLVAETEKSQALSIAGKCYLWHGVDLTFKSSESQAINCRGLQIEDNSTLTLTSDRSWVVKNLESLVLKDEHVESPYYYNSEYKTFVHKDTDYTAFGTSVRILPGADADNKFDVNNDGSVNVTDVVSIYNFVALGSQSGIQKDRADVDGNGDVNVTDVVAVYNYIILGN